MKREDSILITIKVISASDKPLTVQQITKRTGLVHRTIQRHIERLDSADMILISKCEHYKLAKTYQKAF